MIDEHYRQTQNKALALAQTAKGMERDENNYHPLVNLIRQSLGSSSTVASFLLSLLLISFFEYAFHYLGRQYAEQRALLLCHGYDITRQQRQPPRLADGTFHRPAPAPGPVPTPAPYSGTETVQGTVPDHPLQVTVADSGNSGNSTVYTLAEQAKVGQEVECPQCGIRFRKANKWHLFCSNNRKPRSDGGNCSDDWHNTQNPERAAVAAKRGRAAE